MEDEKRRTSGWDGRGAHSGQPQEPDTPRAPYKTVRPKRRRKGELNDGEWAPGTKPKPERP